MMIFILYFGFYLFYFDLEVSGGGALLLEWERFV